MEVVNFLKEEQADKVWVAEYDDLINSMRFVYTSSANFKRDLHPLSCHGLIYSKMFRVVFHTIDANQGRFS